jgi:UDP-N-acetylglucosamine acyltransferase
MKIHPTAIVSPGAELAEDVVVHAYSIVGPDVTIGPGTAVGPHALIDGRTTIGARNQIFPFTTIGYPPQDITYRGEQTAVSIGNDNIIRENVTIHRGTPGGGGVTRIGNSSMIMAYAHIAHDCTIGNCVIIANAANMGGHVRIDDFAIVGGLVALHQFVRIGTHAFVGGKTGVTMDIPPYMLASGHRASLFGPNIIGLKRKNFSKESIQALKKSYKIVFRSNLPLKEAIAKIHEEVELLPEVEVLLNFLSVNSRRGITR